MSMQKEDWESLQGCPGWSALRQYLRDYRERIKESWAGGQIGPGSAVDAQVRCEILHDLAGMDWASIDNFYRPPQDEQ